MTNPAPAGFLFLTSRLFRMKQLIFFLLFPFVSFAQFTPAEIASWEAQSKRVTVIEDNWGIPHIYGQTDADAVFGLLYVQSTQNFARVERNDLEIMGRLSEVEGEAKLYEDLQMRLVYDTAAAKKDYENSPSWFKALLNAFAGGVNFYLYKHPEQKPLVLQRFEPWFALLRTVPTTSFLKRGNRRGQFAPSRRLGFRASTQRANHETTTHYHTGHGGAFDSCCRGRFDFIELLSATREVWLVDSAERCTERA